MPLEAALVLPAASVAVAVRLWAPFASAAVRIAPGAAAVGRGAAEQRRAVIDLDRALASAVPVSVSVLSLVMSSPTMPLSGENEAMLGATARLVSIVTLSAAEAALVMPATVSRRGEAVGAVGQRRRGVSSRPRCRSPAALPSSVAPS